MKIARILAAFACACTWGTGHAAGAPFHGSDCDLAEPPAKAGDDLAHGAVLRIHPYAGDIKADYRGCQTSWVESRGRWEIVGVSYFERGEVAGFWSPPPDEMTCRYREGHAVGDPKGQCPPAALLKVRAMPPGCGKKVLGRTASRDCAPR